MPWRERSPMDERVQFLSDYLRQLWTMTQLCHRYAISRKTAYKWVARYEREGASGLVARSSRPGSSPQATAPREVAAIVALRKQHPSWGGQEDRRGIA
jgi:putative transposase